jgi:large subunit ribosomal protein L25
MMSTKKAVAELHGEVRKDQGKGASRRLRKLENLVPAILYGGGETTSIQFPHNKVWHALENQAFYSSLLTLHIDGKKHQAVLKDVQRHPFRKAIVHMDFQRVKPNDIIHMKVPLNFLGEETSPGVKAGGVITHHVIDIEIKCMASALPDHIDVDLSNIELDTTIHLSEIKLPKGAEPYGYDSDAPVVAIHLPRRVVEEEAAVVAPAATPVLPKGKEAKEGADKGKAKGK